MAITFGVGLIKRYERRVDAAGRVTYVERPLRFVEAAFSVAGGIAARILVPQGRRRRRERGWHR